MICIIHFEKTNLLITYSFFLQQGFDSIMVNSPKRKLSAAEIYGHLADKKLMQLAAIDCSLNDTKRRVLMIILGYAGTNGRSWPSARTIAYELGLHVSTVRKAVKALCNSGYISKVPQHYASGAQTSNEYIGNLPRARVFAEERIRLIDTRKDSPLAILGIPSP